MSSAFTWRLNDSQLITQTCGDLSLETYLAHRNSFPSKTSQLCAFTGWAVSTKLLGALLRSPTYNPSIFCAAQNIIKKDGLRRKMCNTFAFYTKFSTIQIHLETWKLRYLTFNFKCPSHISALIIISSMSSVCFRRRLMCLLILVQGILD